MLDLDSTKYQEIQLVDANQEMFGQGFQRCCSYSL